SALKNGQTPGTGEDARFTFNHQRTVNGERIEQGIKRCSASKAREAIRPDLIPPIEVSVGFSFSKYDKTVYEAWSIKGHTLRKTSESKQTRYDAARTVSVCVVFKREKRGRFAYFALKLPQPPSLKRPPKL